MIEEPEAYVPAQTAGIVTPTQRTSESVRQELIARFAPKKEQLRLFEEEYSTATKQYEQMLSEYRTMRRNGEPAEYISEKLEELTKMFDRTQELSKRNKNVRTQLAADARQIVQVEKPSDVKLNLVSKFKKGDPRLEEFETGKAEFEKLVGVMPNDATIGVKAGGKGRSNYVIGQETMNITTGSGSSTVVHEMGHWWEDIDPTVHQKALAFLERRTEGEKAVRLSSIYPGKGYHSSEITKKDKFEHAYTGKIYVHNNNQYATEIVSMGLESMYKDPVKFAQNDPDYFDFIYNLARGQ